MRKAWLGTMGIALLGTGCATGTTDDFKLASGVYELNTTTVLGDCVIEDAITKGSEFEGKVARVLTDSTTTRVTLEACDPFFENDCQPEPFVDPISMLRDTSDLHAADANWEVPGCVCFEDYRGTRSVEGVISAEGRAELTWKFELPAAPEGCTCSTTACTLTVDQTLVQPEPDL